jgi:hypothetical protein
MKIHYSKREIFANNFLRLRESEFDRPRITVLS